MSQPKLTTSTVTEGMCQVIIELGNLDAVLLAVSSAFERSVTDDILGALKGQTSVGILASDTERWLVKFSTIGGLASVTFVQPPLEHILLERQDPATFLCTEDISHDVGLRALGLLDPLLWGLEEKFPCFAPAMQLYVDAAKRAGHP